MSVTLSVWANSPLAEFPRVRDQVDFRETRALYVPAIRLHRNVMLQQIAWLGAPVDAAPPLRLGRLQPPIDLSRADLEQLLLDFRPQAKAFADPGHPRRQERLQPHRPRVTRCLPYRRQHRHGWLAVAHAPPPRGPPRVLGPWSI